jgi:hypothetical protein
MIGEDRRCEYIVKSSTGLRQKGQETMVWAYQDKVLADFQHEFCRKVDNIHGNNGLSRLGLDRGGTGQGATTLVRAVRRRIRLAEMIDYSNDR